MKKKYSVDVKINQTMRVQVVAENADDAEKEARKYASEHFDIKKAKIEPVCKSIVVEPNKKYVEAILLTGHPDILGVADYVADAGFYIPDPRCGNDSDQFFGWMARQSGYGVYGYHVVVIRVHNLWTALIAATSRHPSVKLKDIEGKIAHDLSTRQTICDKENPVYGAIPVEAGSADDAAKIEQNTEVVQFV